MEDAISKKMSGSGLVHTGPCWLMSFLLGADGLNDPVVTVYDGTDATGVVKVPTVTYDASALGLNGAMFSFKKRCDVGIYVAITTVGTCDIVIDYKPFQ